MLAAGSLKRQYQLFRKYDVEIYFENPMNRFRKFLRLIIYPLLILLIGGLGFWISLFQHRLAPEPVKFYAFLGSLGTFSISIACMSFADFLLITEKEFNGTRAISLFLLMTVSVVLSAVATFLKIPEMHYLAIVGLVLAMIEWILVHCKDPVFIESSEMLAPLGGNVKI